VSTFEETPPLIILHLPTYNCDICGKDMKTLPNLVGCMKPNLGVGLAKSNLATVRMVEMLASMSSTNKDLDAKAHNIR